MMSSGDPESTLERGTPGGHGRAAYGVIAVVGLPVNSVILAKPRRPNEVGQVEFATVARIDGPNMSRRRNDTDVVETRSVGAEWLLSLHSLPLFCGVLGAPS